MSVRGPSMTGRQSLSTRALILSGPGDLFVGREVTIWRISSHDTVLKLKSSTGVVIVVVTSVECSWAVMLCSSLKLSTAFAAFGPTWAKNWLNSSAKTDVSAL